MKKNDFICPNCGAKFTMTVEKGMKAKERIEALRAAGVDVSNMFAMQGANGGEHIGTLVDGKLSMLDDNDPIFQCIIQHGMVPNRKLFRRWVTRQVFEQLVSLKRINNLSKIISYKGYEYQWRMIMDELRAQTKMSVEERNERSVWFNRDVCVELAMDYIEKVKARYEAGTKRSCRGSYYKNIGGKKVFVVDFENRIIPNMLDMVEKMKKCDFMDIHRLYGLMFEFNNKRFHLLWDTKMCQRWIDAYKGAGAYYTMQNLIRFHGCFLRDEHDRCLMLDKHSSLRLLDTYAHKYASEGWRMYGILKEMLEYNNIDIEAKMNSWRK